MKSTALVLFTALVILKLANANVIGRFGDTPACEGKCPASYFEVNLNFPVKTDGFYE
ncbi:hypothetical protein RO3G_12726 [Rhizopus delemar RA 99-880]|uniref:Uncharacterized protein n=1 Tax=Rhizopus delemar (strain RA 99-880 / ATCC MYA-4621 / FGSC 9543 / NRRL 43880) TaxID=246409 RepID=I1CHT5_RHIO9|nr:hypothetical protein RO3G_12726 [Rhizopus delemar RA 99-880]|eukprot:EIE88015.1 hypothetical protein RO3G_12726 [Rhizopus delemar RA 99-880]